MMNSINSKNEIEWLENEIRDKKEKIKEINFEIMMLKFNNISLKTEIEQTNEETEETNTNENNVFLCQFHRKYKPEHPLLGNRCMAKKRNGFRCRQRC